MSKVNSSKGSGQKSAGARTASTKKTAPPARKESSPKLSSLASDVLAGRVKPTPQQTKSLAASVLGQDETVGQTVKRKP